MNRVKLSRSLVVLTVMSTMFLASAAQAVDYTWTGALSSNWSTSSNWLPAGVPGPGDTASVIAGPFTLQINSDITVKGLTVDPGNTIQGDGNITVTGAFKAKDMGIGGAGLLNLTPTCVSEVESVLPVTSISKNTRSKKKIINGGTLHLRSGSIALGADFINSAGATLNLYGDSDISWSTDLSTTRPALRNRGTLIKYGSMTRSTVIDDSSVTSGFVNSGTVIIEDGLLKFGFAYTQIAGRTKLDGGRLAAGGPLKFTGGQLDGIGVVDGDVEISGAELSPGQSPGTIVINGNYTQTSTGTLNMEIGGLTAGTEYDQLIVNGTASLAGTLKLTMWNGYLPSPGNNFQLMTCYDSMGNFSTLSGLSAGGQIYFNTTLTPTYYVATANADSLLPEVSMSNPIAGDFMNGLSSITGTASDTGGSGLSRVRLRIRRLSDNLFWTGSAWSSTITMLTTSLSGGNWTRSSGLPSDLVDGGYNIVAFAYDTAENFTSVSSGITIDNTLPTVVVNAPISDGLYLSVPAASGTAADNLSGVTTTTVRVYRYATDVTSAGFWAGSTTWTATYTSSNERPAAGTTDWSRSLPALTYGDYYVKVSVQDAAGNIRRSANRAFVYSLGTSGIGSSTATATATTNSIRVNFSGPLDATVAMDTSNYRVTVNGTSVAVESATYSASTNSVTLTVPSIVAGNSVVATWTNLFDTTGKTLSGNTGTLLAK